MNHGPCCPIHQSTLDSPDYWTDPALMSSAAPASSMEWRRWEIESRSRHAKWATHHGQWQTTLKYFFMGWQISSFLCVYSLYWKCCHFFLVVNNKCTVLSRYLRTYFRQCSWSNGFLAFIWRMLHWVERLVTLAPFLPFVFPQSSHWTFLDFLDELERSLPSCFLVLGWWLNWVERSPAAVGKADWA